MAAKKARTAAPHAWEFLAGFDAGAFGWQPKPAVAAVKKAVSEIKKVARKEPVLGAEGATLLIERLSPALQHVDSSSGSIGAAVDDAIGELAPIVANAPADAGVRAGWLERLGAAHAADRVPYIAELGAHWGELCGSAEVASAWADRLLEPTRAALHPDRGVDGAFHGIQACLSALHRAERFDELHALLQVDAIWAYKRWAVRALVSAGRPADAVAYAESCRSPWARDTMIDVVCEEILIGAGDLEAAYRYGLRANHGGTYLATFRNVARKYPHKEPSVVLADLVATTPGDEGKWFAAAKEAKLYDEALALATRSPCDPKTLTRAARDHAETHPAFAVGAGLLALHWLGAGQAYEPTEDDVRQAYHATVAAAQHGGMLPATLERLRAITSPESRALRFVKDVVESELG